VVARWWQDGYCGRALRRRVREYRTCVDRTFVQHELRWARQYGRPVEVVHEAASERRRELAFCDMRLAELR
jgi:hypothetical protein